jgi:patatin-like phospholipase/acyl hydrolase
MVDVAVATSAAPDYFPAHVLKSGVPLLDGGLWANNPARLAAIEAVAILGWPRDQIQMLSVGCTTCPPTTASLLGRLAGKLGVIAGRL